MYQKNQSLTSKRKRPLNLGKMIFILACLALPVGFYLVTGHPAFIVVFLSGMIPISMYFARLNSKK
jgi:hypothetical protein